MTSLPATHCPQTLLDLMLDHVREHAAMEVDAGGTLLGYNRTLTRLFGYLEEDLAGASLSQFFPPELRTPEKMIELLARARVEGRVEEQMAFLRKTGHRFQGQMVIQPYPGGERFAIIVRDLSMMLATHDQLHSLATADQITGLFNRQHLFDMGRVEYRRWRRYHVPLSLIVADIDRLRDINNRFGIEAGDSVLRDVADVLRQCVRDVDVVARLEGGLYVAILTNTPQEGAAVLAERVRQYLSRSAFQIDKVPLHVTMSLAVLTANEVAPDFDSFFKYAEGALIRAKLKGGDRIEYA